MHEMNLFDTIDGMRRSRTDLRDQAKRVATIKKHRVDGLHQRLGAQVGEKIQKLRVTRGYSQDRLARRAETSQSAIARLETGSAQVRLDTLSRIALALDADVDINLVKKPASDFRSRDLPKGTPVPASRARRMKARGEWSEASVMETRPTPHREQGS
ncbi:MAG: helix-turn-helix transcriptional regulator [Candidatus Dormiibacterota bacterium]